MILEDGEGYVSDERIKFVEDQVGIKFPKFFIDMVQSEDGGYPIANYDEILYFNQDLGRNIVTGIGVFLSIGSNKNENILEEYLNSSDFFPKNLVPFAVTGGGDYFCFDYREGKHLTDPPIVYWFHEAEPKNSVSFLANNFEDFIGMFKPEGYYDHLLGGSSGE